MVKVYLGQSDISGFLIEISTISVKYFGVGSGPRSKLNRQGPIR